MNQDILTLHRLRIFRAVVSHGSFNRAAQTLLLSQSAVSQHIQQLESGLQLPLFVRSPQGVSLTSAGETLHQHAQYILEAVDAAAAAMQEESTLVRQQVTISASSGLAVYVLPPIMKHFQTLHPTVTLSLQTNPTSAVLAGVADGRYDLGLVAGGCDDLEDPRIVATALRQFAYQVVVHPDHRWARQSVVSAAELTREPFLSRQQGSRTRLWQEKKLATHHIELNTTTELDSPGTIKYGLLSNMGVSILPEYTVAREVSRGELCVLAIERVTLLRPLVLLQRKEQKASLLRDAFVDLVSAN
ncbi:MAG: LysR family transcriptional regulator [Chloroflexota bacterium]